MYRFHSSAAGYKLEVVSLGLYSLQGRIEDVLACRDSIWGKPRSCMLQRIFCSLLLQVKQVDESGTAQCQHVHEDIRLIP